MRFFTKITVLIITILATLSLSAKDRKYDFTKLAPALVNSKGKKAELEMTGKKYILVYYSSNWCGTCKSFTPKLVDFYNKNSKGVFEVIFMSLDFSEKKQLTHMQETSMPWLAVKFSDLKPSGLFEFVGHTMPWISIFKADGTLLAQQNVDLVHHSAKDVLRGLEQRMNISSKKKLPQIKTPAKKGIAYNPN